MGLEKIVVACYNRILRETISRVLAKKLKFDVLAADSAEPSHLGAYLACDPGILVLDSLDVLDSLSTFNRSQPSALRVVLVAMNDDQETFLAAIRNGIRGYVLRDASAAEVVDAICTVAQGGAACPDSYLSFLFDHVAGRPEAAGERKMANYTLTRREQQLVPLIGYGRTNKEIACDLNISEQTVKNHIHRMMRKMQVSSRTDILKARQNQAMGDAQGLEDSTRYLS